MADNLALERVKISGDRGLLFFIINLEPNICHVRGINESDNNERVLRGLVQAKLSLYQSKNGACYFEIPSPDGERLKLSRGAAYVRATLGEHILLCPDTQYLYKRFRPTQEISVIDLDSERRTITIQCPAVVMPDHTKQLQYFQALRDSGLCTAGTAHVDPAQPEVVQFTVDLTEAATATEKRRLTSFRRLAKLCPRA